MFILTLLPQSYSVWVWGVQNSYTFSKNFSPSPLNYIMKCLFWHFYHNHNSDDSDNTNISVFLWKCLGVQNSFTFKKFLPLTLITYFPLGNFPTCMRVPGWNQNGYSYSYSVLFQYRYLPNCWSICLCIVFRATLVQSWYIPPVTNTWNE